MNGLSREEHISNCVRALVKKPDFPAFSEHIQKVLAATDDEEASVRELTNLIIRDYSLTLKLLRASNAYNFSGRPILSITHALTMLGTEALRHLASSLLIFEHFHNKPAGVRELMMLSMLTANHVRGIARHVPCLKPEEAYLCGMLRNLGEVLAAYYLPGPYTKILTLIKERRSPVSVACQQILHFTFEDLGEAVARYWGMPEKVATSVRADLPISGPTDSPRNLLLAAVSMGHRITTAVYRMEPEGGPSRLKVCTWDYSSVLPLTREDVEEILKSAVSETQESFAAIGVPIDELHLETQTRRALNAHPTRCFGALPW